MEKAQGHELAPFQMEWYDFLQHRFSPLQSEPDKCKRFVQLWPRGHSKTQSTDINYVSWLVGNYPDIHIGIVTKTAVLCQDILLALLTRFESNRDYQEIFGELKPKITKRWKSDSIIVNRKEVDNKNPTVTATSLGGSNIGRRNDLIIGDDLIDEENVRTRTQIERASTWFHRILMPTLQPWGAVLIAGTRWHYKDLYAELIQKWPHDIRKAVINEETHEVLWPQFWPYEKLMERQRELGTVTFNCQYQNDPSGMEGNLLKSEWLFPYDEEKFGQEEGLQYYAGIDPAFGEADDQAIATLAVNPTSKRAYLVEVWADTIHFADFLSKLQRKHAEYNYSKIFMEANSFQKVLIHIPELNGLPTVPVQSTKSKELRLTPMSSHFEAKRVLVHPALLSQNHKFWNEWVQFPRGQHDDTLDAVEIVIRETIGTNQEPMQVTTGPAFWS